MLFRGEGRPSSDVCHSKGEDSKDPIEHIHNCKVRRGSGRKAGSCPPPNKRCQALIPFTKRRWGVGVNKPYGRATPSPGGNMVMKRTTGSTPIRYRTIVDIVLFGF